MKIYLIIIRGIYGFQLETIHRHREQSLYSSYDVIYTLYTLCTMNLRIGSISLGQICHVHYFLWLSPIQIRKEGGGGGRGGRGPHFREKQPQVSDFRRATPLVRVSKGLYLIYLIMDTL